MTRPIIELYLGEGELVVVEGTSEEVIGVNGSWTEKYPKKILCEGNFIKFILHN